jgi:hypothetical protein
MFSLASLRLRDFALKKTINAKAQGRQGAKGRTDRSDFRDKIFSPIVFPVAEISLAPNSLISSKSSAQGGIGAGQVELRPYFNNLTFD